MRKPTPFFVSSLVLLFLPILVFASGGRRSVPSSAGTAPWGDPVNQVYALAWSPKGTALATGGKNGVIQVWNTKSKPLLAAPEKRFGGVYALAWSPDGTRLASGGQDQIIHLWNPMTGKQLVTYRSTFSTGAVLAVAWSPDGSYLASGSNNGLVQVWDTRTHMLVLAYSNFSGEDDVRHLACSPDGHPLPSPSTDRPLHS